MVRGLYTAYTGMANEQKRLDIISNNLANAATVGYKKENVTNQSFDDVLTYKIKDSSEAFLDRNIGTMSLGVKMGELYTDYSQGSLRETGNTYDLAMDGAGFFKVAVTDENGNETTKYTRDGSFKFNQNGFIVDADGNRLLGEGGYVQIPMDTNEVSIDNDGSIYCDGTLYEKVATTDFEDYDYLQKYGDNMYEAVEGATEKTATGLVQQGYTEQSNVQTVSEMVEMITITRAYEANSKVIKTVDDMLRQATTQVGKV